MERIEELNGVQVVQRPGSDPAFLNDVSYSANTLSIKSNTEGEFAFSASDPLRAFGGVDVMVATKMEDGSWGLFTGFCLNDEDRKTNYGHEEIDIATLEEFLKELTLERRAPINSVFVFGAFPWDEEATPDFRRKALNLITTHTGLPEDKINVQWTNIYEAEITMVVHPLINTIRVNEYTGLETSDNS